MPMSQQQSCQDLCKNTMQNNDLEMNYSNESFQSDLNFEWKNISSTVPSIPTVYSYTSAD